MKSTQTRSIAVRWGRSAMSVLLSGALVFSTVPTSALAEVVNTDGEDQAEELVLVEEDEQDQELVTSEGDQEGDDLAADGQNEGVTTDDEQQTGDAVDATTDEGEQPAVVDEGTDPEPTDDENTPAVMYEDETPADKVDDGVVPEEDAPAAEEPAEDVKADETETPEEPKKDEKQAEEQAEEPTLAAAAASKSIAGATVAYVADQTYTGSEIKPEPAVSLDGVTLTKGTDFTYDYENNVEAGTATINIIGKGDYADTTEVPFTIKPASISGASVSGINSSYTYTGSVIKPSLTVKVGRRTLNLDTDYTVTYENAVKVGTATITIKGIDNYTGSITKTFKIVSKSLSGATVSGLTPKTYTGSAIKPNVTVKLGTTTLTPNTDYTLSYKNNTNVGKATVTITGRGNYKDSVSKTFAINAATIKNAKVSKVSTQRWTGKAITPAPTVTLGSKTLKLNRDYTLSYKNNTKYDSTATIVVKGKGNYTGSTSITFKIGPRWGEWVSSSGGWWYRWGDGSYPKSQLLRIDGAYYYFNGSGWMVTGWQHINGHWYYFTPGSGKMVSGGWRGIGSYWYYFNSNGSMRTGWLKEGTKWYHLGSDGAMDTGWAKVSGKWYYLDPSSGVMQTGWEKVDGSWYYLESNGAMVTGWKTIGGTTYFFESSGVMATGWLKISGSVYHFDSDGSRDTGWVKINGYWYHFGSNGVATSGWYQAPGNKVWYYLTSQGQMIIGWKTIGNERYWFDGSGAMATGWKSIDGRWYHFDGNGHLERSKWINNYYVGTNGYMYTSRYTPDGYYVDANGQWDGKPAVDTSQRSA